MTGEFDGLVRSARKHPLWTPRSTTREVRLPREAIERILPHRGRGLLLDEITAIDHEQRCCRARRTIAPDDPGFEGHFPGEPLYPGALQVELIGQTGLALLDFLARGTWTISPEARPRRARALKIHHALFAAEVLPGDSLTVLAKALVDDELTSIFAGQLLRMDTICALAIVEVYYVDP